MEAERVRLYAMCDEQAESLNAKSYTDFCEYWTTGKPLTPGAAVVLALFPDLDAAVAEELGRLVDVTLARRSNRRFENPGESNSMWGTLTIDEAGIKFDMTNLWDGNGIHLGAVLGWTLMRADKGPMFMDGGTSPCEFMACATDPAAVCAAIRQVRERIGND